jgi:hypothetical protein
MPFRSLLLIAALTLTVTTFAEGWGGVEDEEDAPENCEESLTKTTLGPLEPRIQSRHLQQLPRVQHQPAREWSPQLPVQIPRQEEEQQQQQQ